MSLRSNKQIRLKTEIGPMKLGRLGEQNIRIEDADGSSGE